MKKLGLLFLFTLFLATVVCALDPVPTSVPTPQLPPYIPPPETVSVIEIVWMVVLVVLHVLILYAHTSSLLKHWKDSHVIFLVVLTAMSIPLLFLTVWLGGLVYIAIRVVHDRYIGFWVYLYLAFIVYAVLGVVWGINMYVLSKKKNYNNL